MNLPPYPKYKPSGVEWIGDVPEHWEVKRLKYSASINDEVLAETTDPNLELSYVDIGSVHPVNGITSTAEMVFEDVPSRARRIVRDGDTIVSTVRTYLRAIAPIHDPASNTIVSTGFAVVRPRSGCPIFMSFALSEPGFIEAIVARSVGVSYPAVNASEIGMLPIPIPETAEQHAIADFLDRETAKINTLIAKNRALIERLKEKRAGLITRTVVRGLPPDAARAVGLDPYPKRKSSGVEWIGDIPEHWNTAFISRIAETIQTGPFGSQLHAEDYIEGGIPVINPSHLTTNYIVPDEQSTIDESTAQRLTRHRFLIGDIVMARRGEIGRCGVVGSREVGWICGTGSFIIRLKECDASYYAMIFSDTGFRQLLNLHAIGATMANLNPEIVGKMLIPVPPPHEQAALAAYLNMEKVKYDTLVASIKIAIERLQEHRTALITSAVTGKIDVRNRSISNQINPTDQ